MEEQGAASLVWLPKTCLALLTPDIVEGVQAPQGLLGTAEVTCEKGGCSFPSQVPHYCLLLRSAAVEKGGTAFLA